MDSNLNEVKTNVYNKCGLDILDFKNEPESREYFACTFVLNGRKIISRNAKITPKKRGQFVTFWKRNGSGPIEPYNEQDQLDFYVVNVKSEKGSGQFVFPKLVLVKKGIISTTKKEGKSGFRVYPSWDNLESIQAERTQRWQSEYFFEINSSLDLNKVKALFMKV